MSERESPAFKAMSDAVLAIAAEHEVEPILQKLVDAAHELVAARYAALGVPDGRGGFARFLISGMDDDLVARMGPLPRTHGLLGAMLESPQSHRLADVRDDARFRGYWPAAHPSMRSFLGVPIVSRSGVIGAFYLTDKQDAPEFDDRDEQLIETLAAHAAIAIENARLFERSRELNILEERNRLARELHDAVTQKLFGVILSAEAAVTLLDRDPAETRVQLERLRGLAQEAMEELRSAVFELRPAALESEGLETALRKHVAVLRRVHGQEIGLHVVDSPRLSAEVGAEVFRIVQEALQNALRHAGATKIEVRLRGANGRLELRVEDDGVGFDPSSPAVRSRRLGLTSMEERARGVGGRVEIRSAPGQGTRINLEVGG